METREALINRITQELQQLPEEYLSAVFGVVARMRTQLEKGKPIERAPQPGTVPFVDEIERVKKQSGRGDDQQFA
jgi:hypothetical protein